MTAHEVGTREEWLAARLELLEREKQLTRRSDELARQRQELPWVRIDKPYSFETEAGTKGLAELFDGRSQLLVFHFMFGPEDDAGCPGCSWMGDHVDGAVVHLEHRDVTFVAASRAPLDRLLAYRRRMGWSFPWVSSGGGDFNIDFALFTEEQRRSGAGYNFGSARRADLRLAPAAPDGEEVHGLSAFALEDGVVYHTYSCYDRGTDVIHGTWQLLDRAPKGRGEGFEGWPRRHDEYEKSG
ncbi:MAG TPA: DUF899 domain-containing protein [Solirubrobacterales bacterium]|nr:DUF899 domain-containing protein [Solirubrobacterales bacterium]